VRAIEKNIDEPHTFRRILTKRVPFTKDLDETSKSFIGGLLTKDPSQRLGAKGIEEIKNHKFFADIDWAKVAERKYKPPIQPIVASDIDVSNFGPEFTNQAPLFSPTDGPNNYQGIFRVS